MEYLHTMVRVHNLEASLRFYCEGLGLEIVSRKDDPQGKYSLLFLATPQDRKKATTEESHIPLIELTYNWPNEQGDVEHYTGGRNFGHLAYQVENIYETCQHLINQGIKILRPPRDGHMAFIRSPDGISIELLQKGRLAPEEPWKSMPNQDSW
jgi:lactoylglutathione lyase